MKPLRSQPKDLAGTPAPAPAAMSVDNAAAEAQATFLALRATGVDDFAAIELAAQGNLVAAAHLWLEALRLVEISVGSFQQGSPETEPGHIYDEGPVHEVSIDHPFLMGAVPITQGGWEAAMGNNPSACLQDGPSLPVECVSWDDICGPGGFLERLNTLTEDARPEGMVFRLPSEAEWEYACRAGTTTAYSFGDDAAALGDYGWFGDNSNKKPHPAGQKKPNAWGLYDMHGNVWEWCQDTWHDTYHGAPKDGRAWIEDDPKAQRVVRGGCWSYLASNTRSAYRDMNRSDNLSHRIGFRVVLATVIP